MDRSGGEPERIGFLPPQSGKESDTRSSEAWRLAARQLGIVTRRQLLALGFSSKAIEHRLDRGRLFPVSLGVYAVGWPALSRKRKWMAAVLAGGEGAALGYRSAAALWEIGTEQPGHKRGLVDPESLREKLSHYHGQTGVGPLSAHGEWRLLVPIGPISRHSMQIQIPGWSAGRGRAPEDGCGQAVLGRREPE